MNGYDLTEDEAVPEVLKDLWVLIVVCVGLDVRDARSVVAWRHIHPYQFGDS